MEYKLLVKARTHMTRTIWLSSIPLSITIVCRYIDADIIAHGWPAGSFLDGILYGVTPYNYCVLTAPFCAEFPRSIGG